MSLAGLKWEQLTVVTRGKSPPEPGESAAVRKVTARDLAALWICRTGRSPFDQHQWNQNISLWKSRSRLVFAFQPNSKENLETPNHWIPRFPLELGSGHPGRSRRDEPGGPESSVPGSGSGLSPFQSDPLQPATKRNQTPPWSRVESSMPSPDLANLAQK